MINLPDHFRAVLLDEPPTQNRPGEVKEISSKILTSYSVCVEVEYSCVNYKDVLAMLGLGKVIKDYPIICGSDFAGTVIESKDARFQVGDKVMGSGFGFGEKINGGFSEYVTSQGEWLLKLTQDITTFNTMRLGNAGLTAFACVDALREIDPQITSECPVIVTGATGGVGAIALYLLSKLGYSVYAYTRNTGNSESRKFLFSQGANEVIGPEDILIDNQTRLGHQRFVGAVDCVGGEVLSSIIPQIKSDGIISCCGHTAGYKLNTTLFPFILRGLTLKGIEMVYKPIEKRAELISKYLHLINFDDLECITIEFEEISSYVNKVLDGDVLGRVVINIQRNNN
jgi:acrylyl-CoA reductase (NADPH)